MRRFRPPFLAHDVGFAPDGRHFWVSSGDRFELAVYDVRSGRLLARPSGDWPPQHVTFSDEFAYVTSGWSGTLRVHRFDGRPGVSTPVPVGSYNVQQAFGWVLTPSLGHGDLCVLDGRADDQQLRTLCLFNQHVGRMASLDHLLDLDVGEFVGERPQCLLEPRPGALLELRGVNGVDGRRREAATVDHRWHIPRRYDPQAGTSLLRLPRLGFVAG